MGKFRHNLLDPDQVQPGSTSPSKCFQPSPINVWCLWRQLLESQWTGAGAPELMRCSVLVLTQH